eukprot:g67495.t1
MEQTGPLNYKIRGYPPYTRASKWKQRKYFIEAECAKRAARAGYCAVTTAYCTVTISGWTATRDHCAGDWAATRNHCADVASMCYAAREKTAVESAWVGRVDVKVEVESSVAQWVGQIDTHWWHNTTMACSVIVLACAFGSSPLLAATCRGSSDGATKETGRAKW